MMKEVICIPNLVASFQYAVVEVLVSHTIEAAKELGYDKIAIAGGVASNSVLRAEMKKLVQKQDLSFIALHQFSVQTMQQ